MRAARGTDINQFLARRQPAWRRLETLLATVEKEGLRTLSAAEVREFGILYRRTSSELVSARSKTANAELLQYLNDLVARAYAQVYRSRRFRATDVVTLYRLGFPRLFRHAWKYNALAAALLAGALAFGWEMNRRDPAGAYYMLPAELVRNIPLMREQWKGQVGHDIGPEAMALLSSFIMTHNIVIGLGAFAGGIGLGLPTLYLLLQTGAMLGILGEAMSGAETAVVFWSLILPHGIVEISAICVMGGAGFVLAGALLAPGRRSRRDALVERGRVAVLLALGGAGMLVAAGLIEGFVTPPAFLPPWFKLLFALLTLAGEVLYFARAGRGADAGLLPDLLGGREEPGRLPAL